MTNQMMSSRHRYPQ